MEGKTHFRGERRVCEFGRPSALVATMVNPLTLTRHALHRAWGRVRSKIAAIIVFTGASTILIVCLAVAALNVLVRHEGASVVEKQIQLLVQASRSVAPAILDHAGVCMETPANAGALKPLLAYTDEAFPRAQAYLTVDGPGESEPLLPQADPVLVKHPDWLPETGFTGLVVDHGQLEIRNVLIEQKGVCKVTVIFKLPLGIELAKRLSTASSMEVTTVTPRPFRMHSPNQLVLRTVEDNFVPGLTRPAAVVLTVRNWETGAMEDWVVYTVRGSYARVFDDMARLGRQLANSSQALSG
jgi:hypothetical protein